MTQREEKGCVKYSGKVINIIIMIEKKIKEFLFVWNTLKSQINANKRLRW